MNMIDDKNINEWLTRFFNGDTSCDEEKALFAYFRQTNIPSSVEQYREMMEWYDTGLQREYNEDEISQKKSWILKPVYRYISLVASIVILFTVGLNIIKVEKRNRELIELYEIYDGSYIMENGIKNTDLSEILSEVQRVESLVDTAFEESLQQTLEGVEDPMERESIINMMSN